jgi:hypothetical protein
LYLSSVTEVEHWMRGRRVTHVITGSVACAAYTGIPLCFTRSYAFDKTQRYPDIDILVPRTALAEVDHYARTARKQDFPVKVDSSCAACYIDLRIGYDVSYLTHRRLRFPIPSELFAPRTVQLGTIAITTIDPRVLLHTFGVFGGVIRRKDIPKINALADSLRTGRVVSSFSENDCGEFSRYIAARNHSYPLFPIIRRAADDVLETLPPYAASTAKHYLLPGTNRALARLNHSPDSR